MSFVDAVLARFLVWRFQRAARREMIRRHNDLMDAYIAELRDNLDASIARSARHMAEQRRLRDEHPDPFIDRV